MPMVMYMRSPQDRFLEGDADNKTGRLEVIDHCIV